MKKPFYKRNLLAVAVIMLIISVVSGGCVYYNTFFNAKKSFNEAERKRKESRFRGGNVSTGLYNKAIEKALKVIEDYPNSKYYDDALFVVAMSYYQTQKYVQADRRFRELMANFPESEFIIESEIYLAKTKLELREEDEAMAILERVFNSKYDKEFRSEAAFGLGLFYFNKSNYETAQPYFLAIRDSLGTTKERHAAQMYIANGFYNMVQFDDARGAYLQILGMEPELPDKFHALYRAASCSYGMLKITEGREYLTTLLEDEKFFDSTNVILAKIAEGYEYEDDLDEAISYYEQILLDKENKKQRINVGMAYYRLGLIYQFDFDDLPSAKENYDMASGMLRQNTEEGRDALERSADIGKLETYSKILVIDSTTTQEMIDEAAFTQFQLAQLYWFDLNKPDSAIIEMQYMVDSFPTAYDVPRGMIALSQMYREYYSDTTAADSILNLALEKYPASDDKPHILDALGLLETEVDTGYAEFYISKAEDFLIDDSIVDSSRFYYQYVIDNYPESDYYLHARFALLWITEIYEPPGDSSLIFAYQEFVDSFPNSNWTVQARKRLKFQPRKAVDVAPLADNVNAEPSDGLGAADELQADSTGYIDPMLSLYVDQAGNKAISLNLDPIEIRERFIYPPEAYRDNWEGYLYFQIRLDFTGEVVDYILKIRSGIESIDAEASETVASMTFDGSRIDPELSEAWFVYKYRIKLPDQLR